MAAKESPKEAARKRDQEAPKEAARKRKRRADGHAGAPARLVDELRAKLECAVCCHMMFPPIRQCAEGHNMCNKCCSVIMSGNADGRKCPSCRIPLKQPVARSRNLEDWAIQANIEVQCDFQDCGARFTYASFGEHMQTCPSRTVTCPTNGCEWCGKPADLGKHLSGQISHEGSTHLFTITNAPWRRGRVTYVRLVFESKRAPNDEKCWRPARQLIEVCLPPTTARPTQTTVHFCVALWKPEGVVQPILVAIQQLRRASCDHGSGWGCELILCRQRHASRLAAPAVDLDSCDDVWSRPSVDKCTGPVLLVPATVVPRFNELVPQQGNAGGFQQKYELTVKLWSEWEKDEGRGVELPAEVFDPLVQDDFEEEAEEEGHEEEESVSAYEDEYETESDEEYSEEEDM